MVINTVKTIIEVLFKPTLDFYGKQYEIGNVLWDGVYKDWRTDGLKTAYYNFDNNELCLTEHKRLLVINEEVQEAKTDNFPINNFLTAYNAYIDSLDVEKVHRVGFRVFAIYDNEMSFSELVTLMQPKFYPDNKDLSQLTPKNYKDVAFSSLFEEEYKEIRLQMGPVTKDELLERTQPQLRKNQDSIPDNSLFIDIDVSKKDLKLNDMKPFITNTGKFIDKKLKNIISYIFK